MALLFFNEDKPNVWKCICGKVRMVNVLTEGYSNLSSHIESAHKQKIEARVNEEKAKNSKSFEFISYPMKAKRLHAWIECVVKGLEPFSFVTKQHIRRHMKYEPISVKTLMKYMSKLVNVVQTKIRKLIPEKFSLIMDGWDSGNGRFFALFISFPSGTCDGFQTRFLAFSPLENDEKPNAGEHISFIEFNLGVFGKDVSNVVAIAGDNCSLNKSIAKKLNVKFFGCSSPRYNIAMKDLLE